MSVAATATPATSHQIVKTFRDTNYFAERTYKRDFAELFSSGLLANLAVKTLLAPLERWRVVKQTQPAYLLRPSKFINFKQFLTSTYVVR